MRRLKISGIVDRASAGFYPPAMLTITTQEAESGISRYLAAVESGEEFLISRDQIPVAKLVPVEHPAKSPRPKVGKILGEPFHFPASALVPLTDEELKEWGL